MTKKIEGYWERIANNHGRFWEVPFIEHPNPHATIVIHEGKPEGVFTESEVKAMLNEISGLAQAYWNEGGHGAPDMLSNDEINSIAERFGIKL